MAAAALIIAGTAISMYGQYKQAESEAQMAQAQANLQKAEAKEVLERAKINTRALEQQGIDLQNRQISATYRGGASLEGSPLMAMEETNARVKEEIVIMQREAYFRAGQLERGAQILSDSAQEIKSQEFLRVVGTGVGGASMLANSSASKQSSRVQPRSV